MAGGGIQRKKECKMKEKSERMRETGRNKEEEMKKELERQREWIEKISRKEGRRNN